MTMALLKLLKDEPSMKNPAASRTGYQDSKKLVCRHSCGSRNPEKNKRLDSASSAE